MLDSLPFKSSEELKRSQYKQVSASIKALLSAEDDWTAAMATVVCELHHAFAYYHWTGFYRVVRPEHLKIGPYQGTHGCLDIPFKRGVCGAAARTKTTQVVADVEAFPGHIACSATTRSEIVVPLVAPSGRLLAVLDVDSNDPDAFDEADREGLEEICSFIAARFADTTQI